MVEKEKAPPGQFVTEKFPVLSAGPTPPFDQKSWDFRIFGEVEEPVTLTYSQFRLLPKTSMVADFHCVTQWSRLDNNWEGVSVRDLMQLVKLKPTAKFVVAHCDGEYTTSLPIEKFLDDDVMLADSLDGKELTRDHGWPARLVVPKLYAWKSAKWVRALEFTKEDKLGFWERQGYNNQADPWKEQRFSE